MHSVLESSELRGRSVYPAANSDESLEQAERIIAEAESWIGTPFHDCANLKAVGVDCANLIAQVYERALITGHIEIKPYSPQWFLHRGEELFAEYVLKAGAHEIEEGDVRMGDIVLYKIGRCFAHGAIIARWPNSVIHAHKPSRGVIKGGGLDGELVEFPRRFFTMWAGA
jgi:cell wall-associated NlpC family hydrolase